MPLFEDLRSPPQRKEKNLDKEQERELVTKEANTSVIWIQAIRRLIEVYGQYFENPTDSPAGSREGFRYHLDLVNILIDLIVSLVGRNSENLSQTGVIYLSKFIQQNSWFFDEDLWQVRS
jgi:hypothetical protein